MARLSGLDHAVPSALRRVGDGLGVLVDFVLPPRCLACGAQTGTTGGLCTECWTQTTFISPPQCDSCGYPFELDFGPDTQCGACLSNPPHYDRARAAVAYDDRMAAMIIRFKHSDRSDLAPGMAAWMRRAGAALLDDADMLIPVPLHRARLFDRRYNQSALLARRLARWAEVPCHGDMIQRHRATPPQGHLSPAARRRNVEGAFSVPKDKKPALRGARVLLIDDVMTTGATANALARRLKRDGARAVDVLTFARVVRPTAPE
jgi:ComF family protein